MKFEIVLKNGASLQTNSGEELTNFFDSGGKSIVARPAYKSRQPKKPGKKKVKK
jgi:hypothetical protein